MLVKVELKFGKNGDSLSVFCWKGMFSLEMLILKCKFFIKDF